MSYCDREHEIQSMLDGEIAETEALFDHIAECASCREHVEALEGVRGMMREVAVDDAPEFDEIWPNIRTGIAREKSRATSIAWMSAAAAACLVALSALSVFSPTTPDLSAKSFVDSVRTDIVGATTETFHDETGAAIVWVNVPEGDMW